MSKVYTGTGRVFQEVQALPLDEEALVDIERRVKLQPHFLGEPLVVIGEACDFPRVVEANNHDLVGLDALGRAVAISFVKGMAEAATDMRALQLAAHLSSLTPEDLGRICRSFINRPGNDSIRRVWEEKDVEIGPEAVELSSLLAAIFERDAEDYADLINAEQRIIVAAEGFSSRMVDVVHWLARSGVTIIGLRYRKYLVGGQEVYFAEQVVPTVDPADDAPESRITAGSGEAQEPWRAKGRAYHAEKLDPLLANRLDELLVLAKPYTFTINWSHKHYFWVRGVKRNLRIRTYYRDRLEVGFYNASPAAVREFLGRHDLDIFEITTVGGYADSPFITITAETEFNDRWTQMLREWLGGEDATVGGGDRHRS